MDVFVFAFFCANEKNISLKGRQHVVVDVVVDVVVVDDDDDEGDEGGAGILGGAFIYDELRTLKKKHVQHTFGDTSIVPGNVQKIKLDYTCIHLKENVAGNVQESCLGT